MHKVGMLVILCGRVIGLQSLEELPENLLRDLTPSSFQIGEARQTEGCIEVMRHRIERPPQRQGIRIPLELELRHSQGVLCPRSALQFRHLARANHHGTCDQRDLEKSGAVFFFFTPLSDASRALPGCPDYDNRIDDPPDEGTTLPSRATFLISLSAECSHARPGSGRFVRL